MVIGVQIEHVGADRTADPLMRLPSLRRATIVTSKAEQYRRLARDFHSMARSLPPGEGRSALLKMAEEYNQLAEVSTRNEPTKNAKRQVTSEDIAYLRLLADWHDRQAPYVLLAVPAGQHDQGRFIPW